MYTSLDSVVGFALYVAQCFILLFVFPPLPIIKSLSEEYRTPILFSNVPSTVITTSSSSTSPSSITAVRFFAAAVYIALGILFSPHLHPPRNSSSPFPSSCRPPRLRFRLLSPPLPLLVFLLVFFVLHISPPPLTPLPSLPPLPSPP